MLFLNVKALEISQKCSSIVQIWVFLYVALDFFTDNVLSSQSHLERHCKAEKDVLFVCMEMLTRMM